jgi:preprotein translocase subunit SecA
MRTASLFERVSNSSVARSAYPERPHAKESALDAWARHGAVRLRRMAEHGLRRLARIARQADGLRPVAQAMEDAEIAAHLRMHARALWGAPDAAAQHMPHTLALVREAARRSLGLEPFISQLTGAACLLDGKLAEMQTGEGKTLTAGIAAAMAACSGTAVHVATVNDYLAQRDAQEMQPLFSFLGLRAGSVIAGMSFDERREAYAQDIAYCCAKELVFDYLKDRAAVGHDANQARHTLSTKLGRSAARPLLLRGLHFAIVDEADGVFIDEARTPLILSENIGPPDDAEVYEEALTLARQMQATDHYRIDIARQQLSLTAAGRLWLGERAHGLRRLWSRRAMREHWALQALRALHMFQRDKHYILRSDKVEIVDEQTGRVLSGRTWEQGLHQMIETKEGCPLSDRARTIARITYQRFFRRYLKLSGMTGTAQEVSAELWRVYGLETVVIPTHRPSLRQLLATICTGTIAGKWEAVAAHAAQVAATGRPVLIGTRSVDASEALSGVLHVCGVTHRLLNARQDAEEAAIVAQAGAPGVVTVATNMAGRGTDIKLDALARERGGLHVILTEFHDSARVDRQLFGRAARQGDPGSVQAIVSLQDTLFRQHASLLLQLGQLLTSGHPPAWTTGLLRTHAQRKAEAIHLGVRNAATRADERFENTLAFSGRT